MPTSAFIPTGAWSGQDCRTSAYTAGAGEQAIMASNVTAYYTAASQRQYIAAYTVDGGALAFFPSNGMATVDIVGNATVNGLLSLQQGKVYRFFPAIQADFADVTLQWVQCTTIVQVVRIP